MPDSSLGVTPDAALIDVQRGLLARILGAPSPVGMPAISRRDAGPSPDERLNVYVRGYVERLRECLIADFPALRGFVGAQVFDLFARGYLAKSPSESRSLYDLGAGFADYLDASRPADGADPLDGVPAEIARLERARTEVHRARGPEDAGPAEIGALILMMPHAHLATPETLRLIRSGFAVKDVLDAVERGEPPIIPQARPAFYAVARVAYRVAIHELTATQFALVSACAGGVEITAALTAAAAADPQPGNACASDMMAWIPRAIDCGLLTTFM